MCIEDRLSKAKSSLYTSISRSKRAANRDSERSETIHCATSPEWAATSLRSSQRQGRVMVSKLQIVIARIAYVLSVQCNDSKWTWAWLVFPAND